jgi:hypothetical protein
MSARKIKRSLRANLYDLSYFSHPYKHGQYRRWNQ